MAGLDADRVSSGTPQQQGAKMDGGLQLPEPAAAEALAKFEAFLDENPDIGTAWAQDRGDTLIRAMKARYAATKRGREVQPLRTFAAWCAAQPDPANLLPESHPVNRWAEAVGLPDYFVDLAWFWFCRKYGKGGSSAKKTYRNWLAVFDESVRERWAKLWWIDGQTFKLSADGLILAKQFPDEDRG